MSNITRVAGNARMSAAVVHGGTVYLKGVTPRVDAGAALAGQVEDVLAQIEDLLARTGSSRQHLLSVMIWLKDIRDADELNRLYDAWVDGSHLPVRACVQAAMGHTRYLVEIQATAAVA